MWRKQPDCRSHPCCPCNLPGNSHVVYLIQGYRGGGEPLPCENARTMPLETAQLILLEEAEEARKQGKRRLTVELRGGDPLAPDRFSWAYCLCQWAWQELSLPVVFCMTTAIDRMQGMALAWYRENQEYLDIFIRWDLLAKAAAQLLPELSCPVSFPLTPENVAGDEIRSLLEAGVHVRVECLPEGECWPVEARRLHRQLMLDLSRADTPGRLYWEEDIRRLLAAGQPQTGGRCYDTSGFPWSCPALSPLKLYSWEMEDEALSDLAEAQAQRNKLEFVCPGELLAAGRAAEQRSTMRQYERQCGFHRQVKKARE